MTEVDFYVMDKATDDDGLLRAACRLVHTVWKHEKRVYVLSTTDHEADRLDELLWTFTQDSFLPHERLQDSQGSNPAPVTCVLIGTTTQLEPVPDLLINLGAPVPEWFTQCARVMEFVAFDPQSKAEGRQRYRAYREQGVPLRTHEI